MVGLIPRILCDLVETTAGADVLAEVKRRAGVAPGTTFSLDEVYDDGQWQRLLASACACLNLTQEQAEEAYADAFCRDALARWPMWFRISSNAREFFERQPRIHNGFATGVRDPEARKTINDKFRLESHNGELIVHYRSPNLLCGLYKAIARWILTHYQEQAEISETRCLKSGDEECEIHICWSRN